MMKLDGTLLAVLLLPAALGAQQPAPVTPPAPTFQINGIDTRWQGGVTVPVGQPVTIAWCVSTSGLPWTGGISAYDTSAQAAPYGSASGSSGSSGVGTVTLPTGDTGTLTVYEVAGNVYCQLQITPTQPWSGSLIGVVRLMSASGVEIQVPIGSAVTFA